MCYIITLRFISLTGEECTTGIPLTPRMKTVAERLLEEPFWIGVIVVLALLLLSGFVVFCKKKCADHFDWECTGVCCKQIKSKEGIGTKIGNILMDT